MFREEPTEAAVVGKLIEEFEGAAVTAAEDRLPQCLSIGRPIKLQVVDRPELLLEQRKTPPIFRFRDDCHLGIWRVRLGNEDAASGVERAHVTTSASVAEHDLTCFSEKTADGLDIGISFLRKTENEVHLQVGDAAVLRGFHGL